MSGLPEVFVREPMPQEGLQVFEGKATWRVGPPGGPADDEEFVRLLGEAEGCMLVGNVMSGRVIRQAPRLRVISRIGVGYDGVDLGAATACGIIVCNAPEAPTQATADLTFGLILAAARRIPQAHNYTLSGEWARARRPFPLASEVHGRTLGIIGFGRIGQAVARRAVGFGMPILYHDLEAKPEAEAATGAKRVDLEVLLREADFISLHVPLTAQTRGLIGAREIAKMKASAIVVNASRGPVVDQKALCEALREKRIAAAGLDVYEEEPLPADDPLIGLDNVVLVPHIASATYETRVLMAKEAAENILAVLIEGRPRNVVNPEVLSRLRAV